MLAGVSVPALLMLFEGSPRISGSQLRSGAATNLLANANSLTSVR